MELLRCWRFCEFGLLREVGEDWEFGELVSEVDMVREVGMIWPSWWLWNGDVGEEVRGDVMD